MQACKVLAPRSNTHCELVAFAMAFVVSRSGQSAPVARPVHFSQLRLGGISSSETCKNEFPTLKNGGGGRLTRSPTLVRASPVGRPLRWSAPGGFRAGAGPVHPPLRSPSCTGAQPAHTLRIPAHTCASTGAHPAHPILGKTFCLNLSPPPPNSKAKKFEPSTFDPAHPRVRCWKNASLGVHLAHLAQAETLVQCVKLDTPFQVTLATQRVPELPGSTGVPQVLLKFLVPMFCRN